MIKGNVHGFYASEVKQSSSRAYNAIDYLRNQLIFLERLIGTLDPDTKTYCMVDMQIANLTANLEEVDNG
ncbi:hypothetical protein [Convivina intestini]|uniref:hypothetical protein n=1 Tax=Convivina intestini TaxID=1505726 RepID=UPI00200EEEC0|nr:hypothetical protein [Convivina intestini]CAH1853111.1 hypothetical protein R078131_00641 [Convivina intestini]